MVRWKYTSHLGSSIARHECANMMLTSARFVVHPGLRDPKASSLRGAVRVALLTKGKAPALVAMKRSSIEKDSEMVGNVSSELCFRLLVGFTLDVLISLQSSVVAGWV